MKRGAHRDTRCHRISRFLDVVWLVGVNGQRVQLGRRGESRHGGRGQEGQAQAHGSLEPHACMTKRIRCTPQRSLPLLWQKHTILRQRNGAASIHVSASVGAAVLAQCY